MGRLSGAELGSWGGGGERSLGSGSDGADAPEAEGGGENGEAGPEGAGGGGGEGVEAEHEGLQGHFEEIHLGKSADLVGKTGTIFRERQVCPWSLRAKGVRYI